MTGLVGPLPARLGLTPGWALLPLALDSRCVRTAFIYFKRVIRAVKIAATDPRIPKPLRWLAGFGLLPIPGPFDEAVLLIVAVPLALFYRTPLAEAWRRPPDRGCQSRPSRYDRDRSRRAGPCAKTAR